jgi:predicted lipase
MYYKDKKLEINNFFKSEMNYLLNRSQNRRLVLILVFIFLIYYFYSLVKSSNHHIIDDIDSNNINSNRAISRRNNRKTSLIFDKIIGSSEEEKELTEEDGDILPLHILVNQYKNGIFIYNMEESVESWWPFECLETKMQHSINTKICIHDPKYDNHISAQIVQTGLWEPVNVRSFLKQLAELPDANVVDIGANIGLYSLLAAKMNRSVIAIEPLHEYFLKYI